MRTKTILKIVVIYIICASMMMSGCLESIHDDEKEVYYTEVSYQSPVYKTVEYTEPVYDTVYHRDPIYETREHSDPVYETISHSEPIYDTLTNLELRDASVLGDEVYRFSGVYDIDYWYSGQDSWGNAEHTFTVYYYNTNGDRVYNTVYQIDEWHSSTYEVITGYNTWSEEVITGYDEWDEDVLVGYDEWIEEILIGYETRYENVVDYYETLYRTEERHR